VVAITTKAKLVIADNNVTMAKNGRVRFARERDQRMTWTRRSRNVR
jgi:hypothetical protein